MVRNSHELVRFDLPTTAGATRPAVFVLIYQT